MRAAIAAARSPIAAAAAVPSASADRSTRRADTATPARSASSPLALANVSAAPAQAVILASPRDIVSPAISSSVSRGARPWPHATSDTRPGSP
jgi:hypothetical protein